MADVTDDRYEEARRRVEAKIGFFVHLLVFVVINVIFLIIAGEDWLWVTLFWGIGLALHGFATFFGTTDAAQRWKERQIQKELERSQRSSTAAATTSSEPAAPPSDPANEPTQPIERPDEG